MQASESEIDFDALVRTHHATVYRCALRVLRSEADARDLAQEVFLEVLEHPERFAQSRDAAAVLAWSATRKALAHLRGDRNRRQREDQHAMRERDQEQATDRVEAAEVQGMLARLVNVLPDELRVALGLRFEEELTFFAIAEATDCSDQAAHDRVRRALDRLRGDMQRAGLAAAVPGIPGLLSQASTPVPGGLETQLLSLTNVAASSTPWLLYGGLTIAAVGIAIGTRVVMDDGLGVETALAPAGLTAPLVPGDGGAGPGTGDATVPALALDAQGRENVTKSKEEGADTPSRSGGEEQPAELPQQAISGRVVDAQGAPLADVWVRASSREYQGKMPLFHDSMHTGADGLFTLDLPIGRKAGQPYELSTRHADYVSVLRSNVLLTEDQGPEPFELTLLANTQDRTGNWQLGLFLADADGLPVAGAAARVMRRVMDSAGRPKWVMECRSASDANGRVPLHGERLGEKRIEIDPTRQGWQTRTVELGIDRPGSFERHVQLVPGLVVEGTITTVDGSPLPSDLRIVVTGEDTNQWRTAELGHGGQFRYEGLDAGLFTLRTFADGWSMIFLREERAGGAPLALAIKRETDDRDIGMHMAEVHGRTIDAETGEPVVNDLFEVEVIQLWDADEANLSRDELLAVHRHSRPYQTMAMDEYPEATAEFHETGLPPARYLIATRVPGYAPTFHGPFELGATDLLADIELALERGGSLTGRALDSAGKPISGAHIYLAPDSAWGRRRLAGLDIALLEEGERTLFECDRARDDGTFEIAHIPTGQPYLLCALSRNHQPTIIGRIVWSKSGEVLKREFVMQPR